MVLALMAGSCFPALMMVWKSNGLVISHKIKRKTSSLAEATGLAFFCDGPEVYEDDDSRDG